MIDFSKLLLVCLLPLPSAAGAPALPVYVTEYLIDHQLNYSLPQGEFDSYLLTFFDEADEAEPWAVQADFNGDGGSDWAGLLRDASGQIDLLVVQSEGSGYSHQILTPLGSDGMGLTAYVVLEPPGTISGFPFDGDEEPVLELPNAGVHLFYFEAASVLYYWANGSFQEFVTSD